MTKIKSQSSEDALSISQEHFRKWLEFQQLVQQSINGTAGAPSRMESIATPMLWVAICSLSLSALSITALVGLIAYMLLK